MNAPNDPSGPAPPPGGTPPGRMPPGPAPAGRDRTELWGWLGIVVGLLCCGILGVIFGVLSIQDARTHGKSPVLGYVAIGVSVLNVLGGAVFWLSGANPFFYR